MILGLLPGIGGGLKTTAADGQIDRLITYYLSTYAAKFAHTYYFSYYQESLLEHTEEEFLLRQITVVPPRKKMSNRLYALRLPWLAQPELQDCQVLRVFQARGALPAMVARIYYGIPYVTTYGYDYVRFSLLEGNYLAALFHKLYQPLALRLATAVIVTTPDLAQKVGRYLPSDRIHLIPNGVDTRLFAPVADATAAADPPTILFVGRLKKQKNLHRLLEASSQLNTRVRVKVIGEGPLRPELTSLAQSLQLDCHFLGNLPYHELPHHYQTASIFVLPSFIEGHPKVLIEAMSCGLSCVVSDCEGNRLLVQHKANGLVFAPEDTAALVDHLNQLLAAPKQAQALGRAARQHIIENYDIHQLLAKETSLLERIARR